MNQTNPVQRMMCHVLIVGKSELIESVRKGEQKGQLLKQATHAGYRRRKQQLSLENGTKHVSSRQVRGTLTSRPVERDIEYRLSKPVTELALLTAVPGSGFQLITKQKQMLCLPPWEDLHKLPQVRLTLDEVVYLNTI